MSVGVDYPEGCGGREAPAGDRPRTDPHVTVPRFRNDGMRTPVMPRLQDRRIAHNFRGALDQHTPGEEVLAGTVIDLVGHQGVVEDDLQYAARSDLQYRIALGHSEIDREHQRLVVHDQTQMTHAASTKGQKTHAFIACQNLAAPIV